MPRSLAALLITAALAAATFLSESPALAQEKPPEKTKSGNAYKVDIAIREKEDGTTVNTRNYVMLLEDKVWGKVRASNRVPIPYEKGFQYMDVGLSIDCQLTEHDSDVSVDIRMEISDFAAPGQEKVTPPVLRTIRSEGKTGIPLGKPTVISVVDDAATKRRYELEVTATKVK